MDLRKCTYDDLAVRRSAYLRNTTAALDGMWENGFFPMADHWEIVREGHGIGTCSVNSEGRMVGFDVNAWALQRPAFASCIATLGIQGAIASTAEPAFLSLCADHQSSVSVVSLMYEEGQGQPVAPAPPTGTAFRSVVSDEFDAAVSFGVAAIQADRDWLSAYFEERIQQNELFGLWSGAELLATGECRVSPNQSGYADVGMIVGVPHRRTGVATFLLKMLRSIASDKGLKAICSTESENVGAQRAIERAGFESRHRILDFRF